MKTKLHAGFLQIHKEVPGHRARAQLQSQLAGAGQGSRPPKGREGQECFLEKEPGEETEVDRADTELLCELGKLLPCYFKGGLFWELKGGWVFKSHDWSSSHIKSHKSV